MPTYLETVDRANKFMEESGIRDFCTGVCKGKCCVQERPNPPMNEKACCSKITCREKLPCVGFICFPLRRHLVAIMPELWTQGLLTRNGVFEEPIEAALKARDGYVHNAFFDAYPLEDVAHLEFPDVYDIFEEKVMQIRQAMAVLIQAPESEASRKIIHHSGNPWL